MAPNPRLAQLGALADQWLMVQGALKCRVQLLGRGSPWQGPWGLLQQGGCRYSQRGTESEPQPSAGLAPVSLPVEDLSAPFYRWETEAHREGAVSDPGLCDSSTQAACRDGWGWGWGVRSRPGWMRNGREGMWVLEMRPPTRCTNTSCPPTRCQSRVLSITPLSPKGKFGVTNLWVPITHVWPGDMETGSKFGSVATRCVS